MEHADPPRWLLQDAGLMVVPGQVRLREGRAWLVRWQGARGILRQLPAAASGAPAGQAAAGLAWLHAFLSRLAGFGFPSPRPLPCFCGRSWTVTGRTLWEAVSFLPGHAVGWAGQPPMEDIGGLLARYHAAARRIDAARQRPAALPLADVPGILLSRQLDTALIDFAGAHLETPLADIGYGLWRSGRPHPAAGRLDLSRVSRFLRGYAGVARVPADDARVIAVYMRGRGLQMIAKRVRAGRAETGMLAQVLWLAANEDDISDALTAAVG